MRGFSNLPISQFYNRKCKGGVYRSYTYHPSGVAKSLQVFEAHLQLLLPYKPKQWPGLLCRQKHHPIVERLFQSGAWASPKLWQWFFEQGLALVLKSALSGCHFPWAKHKHPGFRCRGVLVHHCRHGLQKCGCIFSSLSQYFLIEMCGEGRGTVRILQLHVGRVLVLILCILLRLVFGLSVLSIHFLLQYRR